MEVKMLYPVVVHKDRESCFGVTIPDIPGCFTAGDSLDEAVSNVQEAVECHLHDSGAVPEPSGIEEHLSNPDYADGVWVMVDIDMSFLSPRHKRVNVTIPENVLKDIDKQAQKQGLSRSSFLVRAAKQSMTP